MGALWLVTATPALGQADASAYGVRPGDQIETTLYTAGGEALAAVQGERLVDRNGNVFFPYVGTVPVEGLNAEEIRVLLTQRFEPFYTDPVVTVNVQLGVNITGVVGRPGHYFLDPTATIVDALATAGGAGSEVVVNAANVGGNPAAVQLVRDGQAITLDLRPETANPGVLDMRIQSGDWIHVPARPRSRVRDDVQFWGSIVALFTSVVAAVVIIGR